MFCGSKNCSINNVVSLLFHITRNVYGGLDYLLYKFHSYIADPFRFPFVAVADGTIVSF